MDVKFIDWQFATHGTSGQYYRSLSKTTLYDITFIMIWGIDLGTTYSSIGLCTESKNTEVIADGSDDIRSHRLCSTGKEEKSSLELQRSTDVCQELTEQCTTQSD